MADSIIVRVEGGPGDGQEHVVPARAIETFPQRARIADAIYAFVADIGDDGFLRCRYVLEDAPAVAPARTRRKPRRLPCWIVDEMKRPYLYVLRHGGTHADACEATGMPYPRMLEARQEDAAFEAACRWAKKEARHGESAPPS